MNLVLSVVIPFYKEKEMDLFPLLSTIYTQKGLDFRALEVILVCDGNTEYSINPSFLNLFQGMNAKILQMPENKGPGVARQYGLDRVVGKYVMFCDCDDLLHNVGILAAMVAEMTQNEAEYLSTPWLEESVEEGVVKFVPHEKESTWLHGKMFLRSFLVEHDIRFHEDLRVHEDTYLLSIACELAKNAIYLPHTSYVWTHSPNSITRVNNAIYSFESMDVFPKAVLESVKDLQKRGLTEKLPYKIVQVLCYLYLIAQSKPWQTEETKQYLEKMNQSIADNMLGLWDIWDNAGEDFIAHVYWEEFSKAPRDFMGQSLQQWIDELKQASA